MPTLKYTSTAKLEQIVPTEVLGELTDDRDYAPTTAQSTILEQYLAYAESEAESFVSARYDLPLDPVPEFFIYACLVIAKYRLNLRRGILGDAEEEYDDIIKWLTAVRDGGVDITANPISTADVEVGFSSITEMIFDRNVFKIDL